VQVKEASRTSSHGRLHITVEYYVNGYMAHWSPLAGGENATAPGRIEAAIGYWRFHALKEATGMYYRPDSSYIEKAIARAEQRLAAAQDN
jgi:hypothetical protein